MSKSASLKAGGAARTAKHSAAKPSWSGATKAMVGAGVFVLVVGSLIVAARPGAVSEADSAQSHATDAVSASSGGAASSNGQLSAVRRKYDFGTISMAKGKVSYRYAISNVGTEPLEIRKIFTSCMCTTAALVKNGKVSEAYGMPGHTPIPTINVPIASQEQAYIEVVFDPAAHGPAGVGPIERVVTVENNAGEPLELGFTAVVTP